MFLFKKVPVVKITGKEIGECNDYLSYTMACKKYYKEKLAGKSIKNPLLGEIHFFMSAVDETIHQNKYTIENLKYIAAVAKIIKTSKAIKKEAIRHKKQNIISAWRIKGKVSIKGKVRIIEIVILEDTFHRKYYTFDARKSP